MDISLEEVIFTTEWLPEVILPDNLPVINSSQNEIGDVTPELNSEKELEPEKEKPVPARSRCLRSFAPGPARKKKGTKKRRVPTQDMIEGGTYCMDESAPESVEDGCLLLGLTQNVMDLDQGSAQVYLNQNYTLIKIDNFILFFELLNLIFLNLADLLNQLSSTN